jgi:hypothetical protein
MPLELSDPPAAEEPPPALEEEAPLLDSEAGVLDLLDPLEELPQPTAANAVRPSASAAAMVAILCLSGRRVDTAVLLSARIRCTRMLVTVETIDASRAESFRRSH